MTESIQPSPAAMPRSPVIGILAVLIISAGIIPALVYWAGWHEVIEAASLIGFAAVSTVLILSLCNYLLRFIRWQRLMRVLGHTVPLWRNLRIYLSGLALTATPGKSGELVRGVFLKPCGIPYARSFILFFWDRLSDLAGVLVLAIGAGGMLVSGYTGLLPGVLLTLVLLWVLRPGGPVIWHSLLLLRRRIPTGMRGMLLSLVRLRHADKRLTPVLALFGGAIGAMAYAAHGFGLYILAQAMNAPLGIAEAILVVSVSSLMGAAVLIPGGAGVVEVTSVVLLSAQGVPEPEAVALGIVLRLTTFWFAIVFGTGCLLGEIRERYHA